MTGAESMAALAAAAAQGPHATPHAAPGQVQPVQLGWGASLTDLGAFDQSLQRVALRIEATSASTNSPAAQAVMRAFDSINGEAAKLSTDAQAAQNAGRELLPSELVSLTVRCQEFMFHCQLTSNIANRTSDGLQQLFRQQS
jgi:hypothetical protein